MVQLHTYIIQCAVSFNVCQFMNVNFHGGGSLTPTYVRRWKLDKFKITYISFALIFRCHKKSSFVFAGVIYGRRCKFILWLLCARKQRKFIILWKQAVKRRGLWVSKNKFLLSAFFLCIIGQNIQYSLSFLIRCCIVLNIICLHR